MENCLIARSEIFSRLLAYTTCLACSVFFIACVSLAASPSENGQSDACKELAHSCLYPRGGQVITPTLNKRDLSRCYQMIASHPFCEGTSVGQYAKRRSALFSGAEIQDQGELGFLGGLAWNEECISALDNSFTDLSTQKTEVFLVGVEQLQKKFSECAVDIIEILSRP